MRNSRFDGIRSPIFRKLRVRERLNNTGDGIFRGVMLAYMILGLHVLLLAGLLLLVIFLRGVVHYMLWIVLGGLFAALAGTVYFFRKMRAQGRSLKETMASPMFAGRPVELSLLGGLASVKIGHAASEPPRIGYAPPPVDRLEDPETQRIRQLEVLAGLLEKNLITRDEYNQEKQRLLHRL